MPKLRTPPPGKPFVRTGPDGTRPLVTWDLDLSLRGPLVPPGSYQVRLTVGDSAATAATLTQSLTLLKDPNTAASDADVAAQTPLALAIRKPTLYDRAVVDSLTRLYTKRHFVSQLARYCATSRRTGAGRRQLGPHRAVSLTSIALAVLVFVLPGMFRDRPQVTATASLPTRRRYALRTWPGSRRRS